MEPEPSYVGDRLRRAIEASPYSIRGFAEEMAAAGVPGGSYATVRRIIDKPEKYIPKTAFVMVAARKLNVSHVWLWTGVGPMRERRAGPLAHRAGYEGEDAERFNKAIGFLSRADVMAPAVLEAFADLYARWLEVEPADNVGRAADRARDLYTKMHAGHLLLGSQRGTDAYADYCLAVLVAFGIALRDKSPHSSS
jgi:hypothetical protein